MPYVIRRRKPPSPRFADACGLPSSREPHPTDVIWDDSRHPASTKPPGFAAFSHRRRERAAGGPIMWVCALGFAATSTFAAIPTHSTIRTAVQVVVLDEETLLVRANQPIASLVIDDCYENTDFVLDVDPVRYEARIRLFTLRGPLRIVVETRVPGARNLRRTHIVTVANPGERIWD
jgi:hypothetical protein